MLHPVFIIATEFTWASPEEVYLASFMAFRDAHEDMLTESQVLEDIVYNDAGHPKRNRYWTNLEDAQAWVDAVTAFAAENSFEVTALIHTP